VVSVLVAILSLFSYFTNKDKIKVAADPSQKNRQEIYKTINNPKLNSTKEGKLIVVLYRSFVCGMIGEACTNNPKDSNNYYGKSLLGSVTNLISVTYSNAPASGVYWVYTGLQNAGFVPKTYAAEGIGFASLKAYQSIWAIFRNFAYITLTLVLVLIGFLIMFRLKINQQTVISVENALPRIIFALILITFSYAIAGFLIDLMYLLMMIIVTQFTNVNIGNFIPSNRGALINQYVSAGFWDIYPPVGKSFTFFKLGNAFLNILPQAVGEVIRGTFSIIGVILVVKLIGSAFGGIVAGSFSNIAVQAQASILGFGGGAGGSLGQLPLFAIVVVEMLLIAYLFSFIAPFLVSLLIFFTLIFLLFRVFFLLLKTYVQIVLLIIFAPIILLLSAIPGRKSAFNWFKNLSINLLIFPLVLTIILLGSLLTKINVGNTTIWQPPFLYGLDPDAFVAILGIGLILVIPDIVKAFKEAAGIKGTGIQFGIGTFFGAATAVGAGAFGSYTRFSGLSYQAAFLPESIRGFIRRIPGGEFFARKSPTGGSGEPPK